MRLGFYLPESHIDFTTASSPQFVNRNTPLSQCLQNTEEMQSQQNAAAVQNPSQRKTQSQKQNTDVPARATTAQQTAE